MSCAHGYAQMYPRLAALTVSDREVEIGFPKKWDSEFAKYLDNTQRDGYPRNLDINSGSPIGLGVLQSSIADGNRVTAATALLSDTPKNLTVLTGQAVVKVVCDDQRIKGVATESGISTYQIPLISQQHSSL